MREHTAEAKKFYNSKQWRACRQSFIQSLEDELCKHCQIELGYIVDHKEEINSGNIRDPFITLNHSNLQYLCLECHNRKTFKKDKGILREGLQFNELGELTYTPPKKDFF